MGIFGALTTSVAGLRAQSYALENISGNIANSQTTAFKRIDTSFLDLIPETGVNNQLSGSVTTQSRETNTVQGDIQTASKATLARRALRRTIRLRRARGSPPRRCFPAPRQRILSER